MSVVTGIYSYLGNVLLFIIHQMLRLFIVTQEVQLITTTKVFSAQGRRRDLQTVPLTETLACLRSSIAQIMRTLE